MKQIVSAGFINYDFNSCNRYCNLKNTLVDMDNNCNYDYKRKYDREHIYIDNMMMKR